MKKEIHPGILVAAVVVVIAIAGFFYWRSSVTSAESMAPRGPGATALKKAGGDITKGMTPEEQATMQRSLGGRKLSVGPAGMGR